MNEHSRVRPAPPVRIALAGAGRIAQSVHLKILSRLPGAALVAICDLDDRRLSQARRVAPQAEQFHRWEEMLGFPGLDAVVIALPNSLHAPAALAALNAGKHVYVEKPLAGDLAAAHRLLHVWRQSGRVGMVGFNYRFNPLYQSLRRQLQAGVVGETVFARTVFSTNGAGEDDWRRRPREGGGVLLDLASHHVDLVRFLFAQEIDLVSAQVRSVAFENDSAAVQMRLAGGAIVQTLVSLCSIEQDAVQVFGSRGALLVDRYSSLAIERVRLERRSARRDGMLNAITALGHVAYLVDKLRAPGSEPSYRAALAHFVAEIRRGEAASPSLDDGYESLAVVAAAEESARTGRAVRVGRPTLQP